MPALIKQYSPYQFALVRILLGVYLCWFFVTLLPYTKELFSAVGMLPAAYLPIILNTVVFDWFLWTTNATVMNGICIAMIVCSILFTFGQLRQWMAILLWSGWCLFAALNPFSIDPSLPFVGLLLLVYAIVPLGEPLVYGRLHIPGTWYMSAILFWGLWLVWAVSFSVSGYEKFQSELWVQGTAASYFYGGVLSLDTLVSRTLNGLPTVASVLVTWVILYTQLFAVLFLCHPFTRKCFWFCTTILFFSAIFVLDLFAVLVAMIIFYLFLFDSSWFKTTYGSATVFIDSACPACSWFGRFLQTESSTDTLAVCSFASPDLKKYLDTKEIAAMQAMLYVEDEKVYTGADAIIKSVASLGGIWSSITILWLVPKVYRDSLYRFLSQRRRRVVSDL